MRVSSSDILGLPYGLQMPGCTLLEQANEGRADFNLRAGERDAAPLRARDKEGSALCFGRLACAAIDRAGAALDLGKEARPTSTRPELLQSPNGGFQPGQIAASVTGQDVWNLTGLASRERASARGNCWTSDVSHGLRMV